MSVSHLQWIAVICASIIALFPENGTSQIPTACSDVASLDTMRCCPDDCGSAEGRGQCENIDLPPTFSMQSTDVRGNWPHYFTQACKCNGNYAGYDCSRCKYGFYGQNCDQSQVRSRKSVQDLTDEEWSEYIGILKLARTYDSGYKIVLGEYPPGTTDIETTDIDLYDLFVWQHHYAAKDSECKEGDACTKVDYAHEATGFPTWHRQYILWFEWEIQQMLKSMDETNYHTFRLHYWDWRKEIQADEADDIFQENRLGETRANDAGQPQVYGDLFDDGWDTICWYGGSGGVTEIRGTICNPNNKTGPLLRCPFFPDRDVCSSDNPDWPTLADVNNAIGKPVYDTESFDRDTTEDSFRNFMEGFDGSVSIEECADSALCMCGTGGVDCDSDVNEFPLQRLLHNTVHIIVGIGDFKSDLPGNMTGVMADVAASPNDPMFLNHHGMIDCILEEWLQRNPDREYPDVPSEIKGHQRDGYIVPFFPLFKHSDVFDTAENFGYRCRLSNISAAVVAKPFNWMVLIGAVGALLSLMNM